MATCLEPLLGVQEMHQGRVPIHGVGLEARPEAVTVKGSRASAPTCVFPASGGVELRFCKTIESSRQPRLQSRLL